MSRNLETAIQAMLSVFGQFNRQDLINLTGKSDSSVRRYLNQVKKAGRLVYDNSRKCLLPDAHSHSCDDINEHLRYIRASQITHNNSGQTLPLSIFDGSALLEPNLDYPAIQNLCRALKEKKQVFCHYRSKTGAVKSHLLSPLHLVYISHRYHLRAYSHPAEKYRDFVLGRFHSVEITPQKAISDRKDSEWHRSVTLTFHLNPEQPDQTQESARWEWNLPEQSNATRIATTGALKNYVVRHMTANDYQTGKPIWIYKESFDV